MQTRIFQFIALACLSSVSFLACSSGDDSTTGAGGSAGAGGSGATGGGGTATGGSTGTGGGTPASLSASGCYTFNYAGYTAGATARTLKTDVQPIFAVSCALGGCHLVGGTQHPLLGPAMGVTPSTGDLNTIMTELEANSKEVTAGTVKYMVSGQPENSWMMMKLDQDPTSCNNTFNITCPLGAKNFCTRMPQGTTGLPSDKLSIIRDWIKQGAVQ